MTVTNACSTIMVGEVAATPAGPGEPYVRATRAVVLGRRVLLGAVCLAMLVLLALPWGGTGGNPLAAPGAARAGRLVAGDIYVVRPGDTLWSIAERLAPDSDPRPLVARMEDEVGSGDLQPGEELRLP